MRRVSPLIVAAAAMACMSSGILVRSDEDRFSDRDEPVEPPKPARPRIGHQAAPAVERDMNHPAVIAAQARQRRKAARQAKGFVQ